MRSRSQRFEVASPRALQGRARVLSFCSSALSSCNAGEFCHPLAAACRREVGRALCQSGDVFVMSFEGFRSLRAPRHALLVLRENHSGRSARQDKFRVTVAQAALRPLRLGHRRRMGSLIEVPNRRYRLIEFGLQLLRSTTWATKSPNFPHISSLASYGPPQYVHILFGLTIPWRLVLSILKVVKKPLDH